MNEKRLRIAVISATAVVVAIVGVAGLYLQRASSLDAGEILLGLVGVLFLLGACGFVLLVPYNSVTWVIYAAVTIGVLGQALFRVFEALASDGQTAARGVFFVAGVLGWWATIALLGVAFPVLFPTGRPPSSRWLWVLWLAAASLVLLMLQLVYAAVVMPLDQMAECNGCERQGTLLDPVASAAQLGIVVAVVAAVSSQVVRFRRSAGAERQQIKWLLFAFTVLTIAVFFEVIAESTWSLGLIFVGLLLLPISIVVAISRFHLYDIDRIINRTVVYGLVVAVLALVFVIGTVWIPTVLPTSDNNLAVASTTLVVFLLFQPLRKRVQGEVDRRFYRSRYDAQKVTNDFAGQLRDEIDPQLVAEHWIQAVKRTMQPATVAVWVKHRR